MIENLEDYLVGIVIGVRFSVNFAIEDQLGSIIDDILNKRNSFFNPDVFPSVRSTVNGRILFNETTRDMIEIDNSNVILEVNFAEKNTFKVKQLDEVNKKFESQILYGTMKQFPFKEIMRIGYVRRYLFKLEDLARIFVNKTIGQTLKGINDINLRFSKKLPLPVAIVKQSVNDYHNVIFNIIKKADLKEIFMSVDFQHFYNPFLPTASTIKFITFLDQILSFNREKYLAWLNSNYTEA